MRSKIIKILFLVTFAQIFLYACCGDEFNVFVNSFEFNAKDDADDDSTSVNNESFNLQFVPNYQVDMASLLSKKSGFINTANATSCDEQYNMVKLVEEITLTADVPLFGIAAGSSLNNHVIVEFQFREGNQLTMNDLFLEINNNISGFNYFLRFDTDIAADTTVNFTMTVLFENDEEIENTTTAVTFE